ncbi:MAG TPA: CRISPR-associated helicase Cas3' [Anaerolineaceae bacterium]|nr:CRISPR-associated helicase Cas3' [Anaerolineaceae bacterium]
MPVPGYFHFWAKTDPSSSGIIHPLIYHLLDVGQCTLALWQFALSEQTRQVFSGYLSPDLEATGRVLAFWAALHDMGKAAPGFQRKYPPRTQVLTQAGFVFPLDVSPNPAPHGILTTWALKDLLVKETGLSVRDARQIAYALGGHHGSWPTPDQLLSASLKSSDKGDSTWDAARLDLFRTVRQLYQPAAFPALPADQTAMNTLLTLFSGLVSVADWIGSMAEYFPFEERFLPAEVYAARAFQQARDTLAHLGWLGWRADDRPLSFGAMFPRTPSPNPIQQQAFAAAEGCDLPALVILEAPTGIGKTEAALFLADTWLHRRQGNGMYVAMPTQATSNQMHDRVVGFLETRYPSQSVNAHLVHGAAMLTAAEEPFRPQGIAQDEEPSGGVKAETWFLPRKRTLLAPFGVGTVDQTLLAVLQTRHFFVRMFGLGQKVVVFDEVHAYDTYMSTLFQRLLNWLRSIDTSVILLSATLPSGTRRDLAAAWFGRELPDLPDCVYPRLTVAAGEEIVTHPLPSPPQRSLGITWIEAEPGQLARHLDAKLKDGGCAAVICNRVARAQEVYQAIRELGIVAPDNLILFHARFPFLWRKEIESCVLSLFSKGGNRPHKAIVVATQVIEQSLDLDFDYLVSDLAPLDLLIQRAGRLHRHAQNQPGRPAGLQQAILAVSSPLTMDGLPDFGRDSFVYATAILLRTWLALRERSYLTLPEETTALIESVYGRKPPECQDTRILETLARAEEQQRKDREKEALQARVRLVAPPDDEELIGSRNETLEEDNPAVHEAFRAMTRLSEPSVPLVCLYQSQEGITLEPGSSQVDLRKRPNRNQVCDLLGRAVSVQRREVVDYFASQGRVPSAWREVAALRDHFPAVFDPAGEFHPQGAGFWLKLSRELGLEIFKEEK